MTRMVQHHVAHGWGDDTAQPAGSSQDDEDSDSSVYVDASGGGPASGEAETLLAQAGSSTGSDTV